MIVFGSHGVEAVTLLADESTFAPMLGVANEVSTGFAWSLMPGELGLLPRRDQLMVQSLWSALLKAFAGDLADAAFLDLTNSLIQFPVFRQRKWLRLELVRRFSFTELPSTAEVSGFADLQESTAGTAFTLRATGNAARCVVRLRAEQAPDTAWTLAFSVEVGNASAPAGAVFGFFAETRCALGFVLGADGSVGLLQASSYTAMPSLALGEVHRFSLRVDPLTASVWVTYAATELLIPLTTELRAVALELRAATFDLLREWVPVDLEAPRPWLSWGETGSIAIRLSDVAVSDYGLWSNVSALPALFPFVSKSDGALRSQLDYSLRRPAQSTPYLVFSRPPSQDVYWAESVAFSEDWLRSKYGTLTGLLPYLDTSDSEQLRETIIGLMYGLQAGPTPQALSIAVSALTGAAFAVEPGTVVATHSATGGPGVQVIGPYGVRNYECADGLELIVGVGDVVRQWDFLTEHAEVLDWVDAGTWVSSGLLTTPAGESLPELSKFGRILTLIPGSRHIYEDWLRVRPAVLEYLKLALPVWLGSAAALLRVLEQVTDRIDVRDGLRLVGAHQVLESTAARESFTRLRIREGLTDHPGLRYGDGSASYASVPAVAPHRYGDWEHFRLADPVTVTVRNTGEALIAFAFNSGEEVELPADESVSFTTGTPQYEYPVVVQIANSGEMTLSLTVDGVTRSIAAGTTETITSWTSTYEGTISFTVHNSASEEASFSAGDATYVLDPGQSVTLSLVIPAQVNPT